MGFGAEVSVLGVGLLVEALEALKEAGGDEGCEGFEGGKVLVARVVELGALAGTGTSREVVGDWVGWMEAELGTARVGVGTEGEDWVVGGDEGVAVGVAEEGMGRAELGEKGLEKEVGLHR